MERKSMKDKREKKPLKGQLKPNGSLGKPETYDFIPAQTIIEHLLKSGSNMKLTIGLGFRNPAINKKPFDNVSAIWFMRDHAHDYAYEAYYNGDGYLHVIGLSDSDLS